MPEKYHITYLMGAGASAKGIPIVSEFNSIPKLAMEYIDTLSINISIKTKIKIVLEKYQTEFESASSMDTLAKRYYQTDESRLVYFEYKLFLELIFCFCHFKKKKKQYFENTLMETASYGFEHSNIDSRYENLIRTIGEKTDNPSKLLKVEIPNNFDFISWNYDIHFESAIINNLYDKNNEFKAYEEFLGITNENSLYTGAKLLKLNGSSINDNIVKNVFNRKEPATHSQVEYPDIHLIDALEKIIENYENSLNQDKGPESSSIKFGWENQNDDDLKEKLKKIAEKTDILVLIGYSFPTVNRLVDQAFFKSLEEKDSKVQIYTQGKDFSDSVKIEKLLNQCYSNNKAPFDIFPVEGGDFFYVPAQYFETKDETVQVW
ncbi:hypothetical protein [Emticicia sp. TH156]|uniref:hypothetical protein n=1 Tax=Emticicia sp. TH156 TaxID=2067454 RepID=UPI000C7620D8|nr:hypothetical protein [Emticicia sp. TH156]PLK45430.1 hypothetical protein C0V77_04615 [Emticicia sp. TH156]